MTGCLLLAALLGLASSARVPQELDAANAARHRAAVLTERRSHFHASWELAEPRRRAAAEGFLATRPGGPGEHYRQPTLDDLALATRVLEGGDAAALAGDPWVPFLDRLDLFVAPVTVDDENPDGTSLGVRVHLLEKPRPGAVPAETVDFALRWRARDGTEVHGRREPIGAQHFREGFPMYLRTPPHARGRWWLVPVVRVEGRTLHGWPVPVEIVPRFGPRLEAVLERLGPVEPVAALLRWQNGGVRLSDRLGAEGRLAWLERTEAPALRWTPDRWIPGASDAARVLVLVASSQESAAGLLHGPAGEGWHALAGETGMPVATLELRELVGGGLGERLETLRAASGAREVVLLVRGDAAVGLHLALANGAPEGLAGLVLVGSFGPPGPRMPSVPTLLVGCGRLRDAEGTPLPDAEHVTRLEGPRTLLLLDLGLAGRVQAWLAGEGSAQASR